jgi:hypothetical protein
VCLYLKRTASYSPVRTAQNRKNAQRLEREALMRGRVFLDSSLKQTFAERKPV